MSTFTVTAEPLVIHPHPNADALELAQVGLYRAVVGKGVYQTGDYAIYIPEQAVLPAGLIEELGLTGRLAGKDKNRVRAVRLRGELSQGIVCLPEAVVHPGMSSLRLAHEGAHDYADELGITKWVPEIPASMAGDVFPAPDLLPWIDIENIKRYPGVFGAGEPVTVTEKLHGSACLFTYIAEYGDVYVTSKGQAGKHLALVESTGNLYWRAARAHHLAEIAANITHIFGVDRVGLYGEVYGAGVQDLTYGASGKTETPGYALFDIQVDAGGDLDWLTPEAVRGLLDDIAPDLPTVPVLYEGPFDLDTVLALADGQEQVTGRQEHIREGVVIRSSVERRSPTLGGRAILKAVSAAYLTRGGNATEYE